MLKILSDHQLCVPPPDSMSTAVDLLLKAAGCIEFLIRDVLIRLPPDIKYANIISRTFGWLVCFFFF